MLHICAKPAKLLVKSRNTSNRIVITGHLSEGPLCVRRLSSHFPRKVLANMHGSARYSLLSPFTKQMHVQALTPVDGRSRKCRQRGVSAHQQRSAIHGKHARSSEKNVRPSRPLFVLPSLVQQDLPSPEQLDSQAQRRPRKS